MKYRASGIGNLMVGDIGLTDKQSSDLAALEVEKTTGQNVNGNKVKWTANKQDKYDKLIHSRDNPELSETAKTFILESMIYDMLGVRKSIKSKYLDKGVVQEDLAIEWLSRIDNKSYKKNTERKSSEFVTGECDVDAGDRIIDIKNSWDFFTFFAAEPSSLYEWQGRAYMELWGRDKFELVYVLNDMPLFLFHWEVIGLAKKYSQFSVIEEVNELFPICDLEKGETDPDTVKSLQKEYLSCLRGIISDNRVDQLIRNSFFDWLPIEKRIKRFEFERDEKWLELEARMPHVRKFEEICSEKIQPYEIF